MKLSIKELIAKNIDVKDFICRKAQESNTCLLRENEVEKVSTSTMFPIGILIPTASKIERHVKKPL
jgi:hypothetical protein